MNDITPKEAIANLNRLYGMVAPDIQRSLDVAIKALEIVDDVNHKVYRNENCPRKHKCYDYQGYHCSGCSWEEKGGAE